MRELNETENRGISEQNRITHTITGEIRWRDPNAITLGQDFQCFCRRCHNTATVRSQLRLYEPGKLTIPMNLCLCAECANLSPETIHEKVTLNEKSTQ